MLDAAKRAGGRFNVLHMHGEDVMFDLLNDYDVTALNWHTAETSPSIADDQAAGGGKPILGGLQRGNITRRDQAAKRGDIEPTMAETGGCGILGAPAGVIRHPVDEATLLGAAAMIKGLGARRAGDDT